MSESLKGKLLVAQPSLLDPNFRRSVILLLEAGEGGAIGIALNRPTEVEAGTALGEWASHAAHPAVIYVGGPVVEAGTAICLAGGRRLSAADGGAESAIRYIGDGIGTLDVGQPPATVGAAVEEVRLFAGYAGWAPQQLESEIESGSWFIFDARNSDIFTSDPGGLWKAVVRRQPGMIGWFATFPPDPVMN